MIAQCAHGHVCLVNVGRALHPLLLDPCDPRGEIMLSTDWTKAAKSGAAGHCLQARWVKATASNPNGNCLEARWEKAEASLGNGTCVEAQWQKAEASATNGTSVEARTEQGSVQIRDSKDPDGPVLTFTPAEWDAFLDGAKKGEFDLPDGVTP